MENSNESFEDLRKIEELTSSQFFEFIISNKFNAYLSKRYHSFKKIAVMSFSLLLAALSYLGLDAYRTTQILNDREAQIKLLSKKVQELNIKAEQLFDEAESVFQEKYDSIDLLHTKVRESAAQVDNNSALLTSNVGNINSSLGSIDSQWKYLKETSSGVVSVQQTLEEELKDSEMMFNELREKLENVDDFEIAKLESRVRILERSENNIFEMTKQSGASFYKAGSYDFELWSIDKSKCTLLVRDNVKEVKIDLNIEDKKIVKLDENEYIELVHISNSYDGFLKKGIFHATMRYFTNFDTSRTK